MDERVQRNVVSQFSKSNPACLSYNKKNYFKDHGQPTI